MITDNARLFFGANFEIIGKTHPELLSAAGCFQKAYGTPEQLAKHIGAGFPWMPGILPPGKRRYQHEVTEAIVLGIDVDEGMTIDEALSDPFIKNHCCLGIESASSKPDAHKFRLVFKLPRVIEGWRTVKCCNVYLGSLLKVADRACTDASRYFFGAPGRVPFLVQDVQLPETFVDDAIASEEAKELAARRKRQEYAEKRQREREANKILGRTDPKELIEQCNDRLGQDAFLPWLDTQIRGEKVRCKPMFRTGSGSYSARLGAANDGTVLYFDDVAGHKIDGFTFFCWIKHHEGFYPKGSEFWSLLKEYCQFACVEFPERTIVNIPDDEPEECEGYEPSDRVSVWTSQAKNILDLSPPGTGKSHASGLLKPEMFGLERIVYVSTDSRNVTTATLKDWTHLESRHAGLTIELSPDGSNVYRRTKAGDTPDIKPNCWKADQFQDLFERLGPGAGSAICGNCYWFRECKSGTSDENEYGYLFSRKQSLKSDRIVAHPASLPQKFPWKKTLVIWEEASTIPLETRMVITEDDRRQMEEILGNARKDLSELFSSLARVVTLSADVAHGVAHAELLKLLPSECPVSSETVDGLLECLDINDRPKYWLPDVLRLIEGVAYCNLRIVSGELEVVKRNTHLLNIARKAGKNLFLDATARTQDIVLKFGLDEVVTVKQKTDELKHLHIFQIRDLGKLTRNRRDSQQERLTKLLDALNIPAIDFKLFKRQGSHFISSRGVNFFEGEKALAIVGTPTKNLGAMAAVYSVYRGVSVPIDDEAFRLWIDHQTEAEIVQGVGRMRAERRTDDLSCWIINNMDFKTISPIVVSSGEICKDAQPRRGSRVDQILEKGVAIVRSGEKLTQKRLADAVGITQQAIQKLMPWAEMKALILTSCEDTQSYTPAVGDRVEVISRGECAWFVVGFSDGSVICQHSQSGYISNVSQKDILPWRYPGNIKS